MIRQHPTRKVLSFLNISFKKYHSSHTTKIHILLLHKFPVLSIFINSHTIFLKKVLGPTVIYYLYTLHIHFLWKKKGGGGDSYLMVLSFCMHSCSCIMAWWRPTFKVENRCQTINDQKRNVLCALENINIHLGVPAMGDVSYKEKCI